MEDSDATINDIYKELLELKNELMRKEGLQPTDELDLYLIDHLFPVLFPALEELSKEVERYQDKNVVIDERIRSRFNPCLFLAQYLMRNNPKYNPEQYENNEFRNFSERIRKTKTLTSCQEKLMKLFNAHAGANKLIGIKNVESIMKKCDDSLKMGGELVAKLHLRPKIIMYKENKEDLPLDEFYSEFNELLVKNDKVKDKAIREKMLPALNIK